MQSKKFYIIAQNAAQRGSAVMIAVIALVVAGAALMMAQGKSTIIDTKSTAYSGDQNLAQAAAALAVSAGKSYVNALSSKPTTCSSSGCATVYSGTALTNGAAGQNESWWATAGNVHSASCSSLSGAGNVSCAYTVEQTGCDTGTGNVTYTVTGFGYFNSSGGANNFSQKTTTSRSSATVVRNAFATASTTPVTFYSPSLCNNGNVPSKNNGLSAAATFTANSSATGSTFTGSTGIITSIGIAVQANVGPKVLYNPSVWVNGTYKFYGSPPWVTAPATYNCTGGTSANFSWTTVSPGVTLNSGDTIKLEVDGCVSSNSPFYCVQLSYGGKNILSATGTQPVYICP